MDKRNHLIDLLRFVAATWVAIFHFNEPIPYIANWYRSFLKIGYVGVAIFFVISGYCVYLSALRSKTPRDFLVRRICRIFPPYWFSILLVGLSVIVSLIVNKANSVAVLPKNISGILATITLSTTPLFDVPIMNWVYWTLTYEVVFYFLVFISMFAKHQYRIYSYLFISISGFFLPVHEMWPLFFVKYWPAFALGVATYRLLNEKTQLWQTALLLAISVSGLFYIQIRPYEAITCIITAVLIVSNNFKPLKANPISTLGDYSYSIYLTHVPLGIFILGVVKQQSIVQNNVWVNIVWDLTLYAVIVCLAKLMFKFIELPAISFGKKITNVTRKAAV
ncbi:acyltransferase [Mucilaginibacter achroorhodeus]|uniref:Acyltransferase n=1 Tax=Mucilaginibacter achroorhodeus TaxID=2599294 RepID=A0A563U247_9SPHI|nr:acyltransferase [Mucilaginibacter achroorhodeus]TWR25382.1 acyltransferase [Mucilaginibacter achroorhodeus]